MKGIGRSLVVVLLLGISAIPSAQASEVGLDPTEELPANSSITSFNYFLPVSLTPDRALTVGSPVATMRSLDATGLVTEVSLPTSTDSSFTAAATGAYDCVNNTTTVGFKVYPVGYATLNNVSIYLQFVYELYSYDNARFIQGVGYTFQVEYCSSGGARSKENWRLMVSGTAVAHANAVTRIIGWKWFTGKTPATVSSSLGFKVGGGKIPISISGSVSVTPVHVNTGAQGEGPFSQLQTNKWATNAVNAWWQGACSFFSCGAGKEAYEGAVGHGLWEFPMSPAATYNFAGEAYAQLLCNPAGYKCPQ